MAETEAERLKNEADERPAGNQTVTSNTDEEAWEPRHIDEDDAVPTSAADFYGAALTHARAAVEALDGYLSRVHTDDPATIDLDEVEEQLVNARTGLLMARGMEQAGGDTQMNDTENGNETQPDEGQAGQPDEGLEPGEGQTIEPEREGQGPTAQPGPAGTPGGPSETPSNPN